MRMPFGKYRGDDVEDIPENYLQWLLEKSGIDLDPDLENAVKEALEDHNSGRRKRDEDRRREQAEWLRDRFKQACGQVKKEAEADQSKRKVQEVVSTWFRRLSLLHHPDKGGTDERMRVVNEARELLDQLMRDKGII